MRGYGGTITQPDGSVTRIWFDTVLILPQGVAAAGPVLQDTHYAPGPYVIVDIGYRTTDFIVVTKQSEGVLDFDPTAAGSLEWGMHAVDQALADQLTQPCHKSFSRRKRNGPTCGGIWRH